MITPSPLHPGDKIAIISPATEIKSGYIDGAIAEISRRGYIPVEMPYARGHEHGTFAATDSQRLDDLTTALTDPTIKAILCGRGGYGSIHLLSRHLQQLVRDNPKWIIGFSDISALHALWLKAGVKSIHASMAKQLTLYAGHLQVGDAADLVVKENLSPSDHQQLSLCTDAMWQMMENPGSEIRYSKPSREWSTLGEAKGMIVGGNLAVLNGLAGTPWDILTADYLSGKILFLEDVGEKIYQVERMLKRLHLCGALDAVEGLIFGDFTDYKPDRNFSDMTDMIRARLEEWEIFCPTALHLPIGHTNTNLPIMEGSQAHLSVTTDCTTLTIS